MRVSTFLFASLVIAGCAGSPTTSTAEDLTVTYTVTYDVGRWSADMIRIMECDATTGLCDVTEPEGCRLVDETTVRGELTGHICDYEVDADQPLAFNVQVSLHPFEIETDAITPFTCDPRPEIAANLGSVHVFRDGVPVDHELAMFPEAGVCNFLVRPPLVVPAGI
jgi:hypothetical protein